MFDPNIRLFQLRTVPEHCHLAGLSALVQALGVDAPVRHPKAVSQKQLEKGTQWQGLWQVFGRSYAPEPTLRGHLQFALKYDVMDLLVWKRVLEKCDTQELAAWIRDTPTGSLPRRAWFLAEWLAGHQLDVPDAPKAGAVELFNPKDYLTLPGELSVRHRVRNNALGTASFCPMVRQTPTLQQWLSEDWAKQGHQATGHISQAFVNRAASFLLLADSRASFEIEGERAPRSRLERWGKAVLQSGQHPLTVDELLRLHQVLIEDNRFIKPGLREDGVFLGERGPDGEPLPEFIGAKPDDLPDLMTALLNMHQKLTQSPLDAVVHAAIIAFAFVYIHPFQDGNGRLHRCLIHHVLAERGFTPPGLVFPVSSVMLERMAQYQQTLQQQTVPLMTYIDWDMTLQRNVTVNNPTADLYRYPDCTAEAEFLYGCVARTISHDLPQEVDYLQRRDTALRQMMQTVDMPDALAEDFLLFTRQNGGTLPKTRRKREFAALTDAEVTELQTIIQTVFEGLLNRPIITG